MKNYDLSDRQVRQMVLANHTPTEQYPEVVSANETPELSVVCRVDGELWPCALIRRLRSRTEPQRRP